MKKQIVITFLYTLLMLPILADEQTIPIQTEPAEVLFSERKAYEIELPEQAEGGATLSFRAWLQAERFAGYVSAMKVYWDGEELLLAKSHPEQFTMKDGRDIIVYYPSNGWALPYVFNPEEIQDVSQYFPQELPDFPNFDPSRFEFDISGKAQGKHLLEIQYIRPSEAWKLFVDEVKITLEK